jgi:hypothetical protein
MGPNIIQSAEGGAPRLISSDFITMGSLHTYTSVARSSRFLATALCHSVVHATATSSMYTRTGACVGDSLSYVGWFRTGIGVAMDCRDSGMDYAREMLTMVCVVHMAGTLC